MRFIRDRKRFLFLFLLILALPIITAFALDNPSVNSQVFSPTPFPSPTYPPMPQPLPVFIPSPVPGMPPDMQRVTIGEPFQGQLASSGYPSQHVFEGRGGQFVIVSIATSEPVGFSFYLGDANGYPIAEVTRFANGLIAFLPYDGDFLFTISPNYNYGNSIGYSLSITTPDSGALNFGDDVSLQLTPERPAYAFRFQGEQGDLINLSASSGAYNLTTLLIDSFSGYVMADSRYSNRGPYPGTGRISLYSLPATQEYYTVVFAEYLPETIDFSLKLNTVEPVHIESYGETINGQFGDGTEVAYYTFEGNYADIIDVTLMSDDNLDTLISIFGPNNADYRLTDDDGGAGDNPEILNFLINPEGTYLIEVQPFNTGASGAYTLNVDLNTRASLNTGSQRVDMGKNPQQYLSFDASSGEQIRLKIEVISGFMPVLNVTQQNALIANIGIGDLPTFVTEFAVPNEGAVLVSLSPSRYYSPNTVVEINVERIEAE